jgi:DNA-binding CsgD family transcriptional regulator
MTPPDPDGAPARPVPRKWLAPHAADSTRLDRLCADAELAERLHRARYRGRDWNYFVTELIKYGYAVLISWMRSGLIWRRLADRNIGGLPAPPAWEWHNEAWNEIAGMTMVVAVEKFRDTVLIAGRWNPQRGASLKTYFIGQCLFRFPNVYRAWRTSVLTHQAEIPEELQPWQLATPTTSSPERQLIDRDEIDRELGELDDRTRAVLLLLEQGYDQAETAARLGTTRKSIEMVVRRHRARAQRRRKVQHGHAS